MSAGWTPPGGGGGGLQYAEDNFNLTADVSGDFNTTVALSHAPVQIVYVYGITSANVVFMTRHICSVPVADQPFLITQSLSSISKALNANFFASHFNPPFSVTPGATVNIKIGYLY